MSIKTYYHILNISPRASDEEVRRAWHAMALRWHPDRNPRNRAQAQKMFILVNRSYTLLKSKPQRDAYNRRLLSLARPRERAPSSNSAQNVGFFGAIREILWPLAENMETRHG